MTGVAGFTALVALLLLLTGESLLSVWIFATSLTLIVHTYLFQAIFPDTVTVVLRVMLKFLRLNFEALEAYYPIELPYYQNLGDVVEPSPAFLMAGYQSARFNSNMSISLKFMLVAPLVLLVLALLKDVVTWKCRRKDERHCLRASWARPLWNLYLRVVFLLLLEIAICASLELKATLLDGHGYESPESLVLVGTALLTSLLLLIFVIVVGCQTKIN